MDDILTEFLVRTQADAALAHDLLEAAEWNLDRALTMYDGFMNTQAVDPVDEIPPEMYGALDDKQHTYHYGDPGQEAGRVGEEEEDGEGHDTLAVLGGSFETRRDLVRSKRDARAARGLSFLADDVVDRFHKVAVSRHRVSQEEQTVIDDQFFRHSFVYPDFTSLEQGIQEFIAADLIDVSLRRSLETTNRLNWWTHSGKFPRLEPLATSGDGNCLLHAASLYMWGFHDRFLILRTSMHRLLTQSRERDGIQSRWRYQTQLRNNEAGGLIFSEDEWSFEWSEVVRIATNAPREQGTMQRKSSLRLSFEYLEEIHIFALAHVTQRPIIVIADTMLKGVSGEDLAPIYFGGVYLPLEMNPTACHKSPVVLAYDAAHFSALVAKEEKTQQPQHGLKMTKVLQGRSDRKREEPVVPLVDPDGRLLPIQFVYDPNKPTVKEKWGKMKYKKGEFPLELIRLLESYLKIRWVNLPVMQPSTATSAGSSPTQDYDHLSETIRCPAAHLGQESQPVYQKDLIDKYLTNVKVRFEEEKQRSLRVAEERERQIQFEEEARLRQPVPCRGPNCDMFGTLNSGGLCSVCYQKGVRNSDDDDDNEVEKVDLASVENRELDPETVEGYIPRIEEHLPSYDRFAGTSEQRENEPMDYATEHNNQTSVPNGLTNSDLSTTTTASSTREDPSPQPSPHHIDPNSESESNLPDSASSSTSIHSSTSEGSRGDKSPKKSRGGWMKKKLQAFPAGLRAAGSSSKPKKSLVGGGGGDTQQRVKSVSYAPRTTSPLAPCINTGCEFFRARNCMGYCETCFQALNTYTTTEV